MECFACVANIPCLSNQQCYNLHACRCWVQVRGKAMASKAGDMLDIARDILLTARLDDCDRFKQVLCFGSAATIH